MTQISAGDEQLRTQFLHAATIGREPLAKDVLYWASRRAESLDRLNKLSTAADDMHAGEQLINWMLATYDYDSQEISGLNPQQRDDLAKAHLYYDYLILNFFEIDGQKTALAERYYPLVDPEEYRYSGRSSRVVVDSLAKQIINHQQKQAKAAEEAEENRQFQEIISRTAIIDKPQNKPRKFDVNTGDVVEEYNHLFGQTGESQPVICVPGTIDIDGKRISIKTTDSFQPPYGHNCSTKSIYFKIPE